jgi:hypothetical protein
MFLVHLSVVLGYLVSKGSKLLDLKKILNIVHMPISKTCKDIKVFMAWHNTIGVSSRTLLSLWLPSYYER